MFLVPPEQITCPFNVFPILHKCLSLFLHSVLCTRESMSVLCQSPFQVLGTLQGTSQGTPPAPQASVSWRAQAVYILSWQGARHGRRWKVLGQELGRADPGVAGHPVLK